MPDRTTEPISQDWIKIQIDSLLSVAKDMPENSSMRSAILHRVDIYMDLLEAWRKRP